MFPTELIGLGAPDFKQLIGNCREKVLAESVHFVPIPREGISYLIHLSGELGPLGGTE